MRFTCGFAGLVLTLLASAAVAQADFCPGGMNLELTALTVPQPAVAPLPPPPSAPPPPAPKKQAPPKQPKKKAKQVPSRPAPPSRPQAEPEPEEAPPPPRPAYPQRSNTDAALDDMIGTFGSRPQSGPNIDYTAPLAPNRGLGEALRQDAAIRDHFGRRERRRDRHQERPSRTRPQSTPQSTPHTEPISDGPAGTAPVPNIERDSFDVR